MKSMFWGVLAAAALMAAVPANADDAASVRDFLTRYDRAYESGDFAQVREFIADDYMVVNNGKRLNRAAAEAEYLENVKDGGSIRLDTTVDRVLAADQLATASGTIQWTETDKAGKVDSGTEYFTIVLRRAGEGWTAVNEHLSAVNSDD